MENTQTQFSQKSSLVQNVYHQFNFKFLYLKYILINETLKLQHSLWISFRKYVQAARVFVVQHLLTKVVQRLQKTSLFQQLSEKTGLWYSNACCYKSLLHQIFIECFSSEPLDEVFTRKRNNFARSPASCRWRDMWLQTDDMKMTCSLVK